MMSSVIAAFFTVYLKNNSLHGQCPEGSESWCRYQRAKVAGVPLKEIEQGLPNKIINQIKHTYLKLCNVKLVEKMSSCGEPTIPVYPPVKTPTPQPFRRYTIDVMGTI
ncbi:uncharacterized protein LOC101238613 [Trichonephila clavipes]|nr:uncharacterized protein LOC101238613 [Trichonephila clavipes]